MLYGVERYVSPLDWSNTRRTFDGFKGFYSGKTWDVDAWWTQPVPFGQHIAGGLQDHNFDYSNDDQEFAGLYASYKAEGQRKADFYYLRLADYSGANRSFDSTINNGPTGDFDFNLLATRLAGGQGRWLWEFEGGYQFGQYGADDIRAGAFTVGLGRKFPTVLWQPTLWAYYDWASGDNNPNDGRHGTFNQYFPLGHKYLGWMDIIGRQNIEDANLLLVSQPREKIKFLVWYHVFFLQTARDGLYNAGGNQIYIDPTGNAGEDVGQELDLIVKWTWTPRTDIWFGYSHFFTGDYFDSPVIQAQGATGRDADFFYTQFTVNF